MVSAVAGRQGWWLIEQVFSPIGLAHHISSRSYLGMEDVVAPLSHLGSEDVGFGT